VGKTTLADAREHARQQLALLPPNLRSIDHADDSYEVVVSNGLQQQMSAARAKLLGGKTG
jgi:nicotinate phosphoribosyltransferase